MSNDFTSYFSQLTASLQTFVHGASHVVDDASHFAADHAHQLQSIWHHLVQTSNVLYVLIITYGFVRLPREMMLPLVGCLLVFGLTGAIALLGQLLLSLINLAANYPVVFVLFLCMSR